MFQYFQRAFCDFNGTAMIYYIIKYITSAVYKQALFQFIADITTFIADCSLFYTTIKGW